MAVLSCLDGGDGTPLARGTDLASRHNTRSAYVLFPARRLRPHFERQPTRRKKPTRGEQRPIKSDVEPARTEIAFDMGESGLLVLRGGPKKR